MMCQRRTVGGRGSTSAQQAQLGEDPETSSTRRWRTKFDPTWNEGGWHARSQFLLHPTSSHSTEESAMSRILSISEVNWW
jgi:hypothetical protein